MRRFGDEVLLHSQQRHPNIVQLIGVYYPPRSQLPMLVMEYLPLSLTQCLEREELPLQMKYSILVDVAKGLCYLHGKRPPIVHRDLTANNVLLTSSYLAKISDLGVSRLADTFKKHHLTTAPGNAMVMPPEALEDNPVYDHKLDVFSYGCLILHVLTGQFPQPTNQFVQELGKQKLFKKVSELDRRSSYIKNIPKENELLPLAKDCLNDAPTDRLEMSSIHQFMQLILSKYPKMKSTIELIKENQVAEKREQDLQRQLQEREQQLEEREREFQERERQLEEQIQVAESSWVVDRREIIMTEVVLGKGGWGEVKVAGFRGLKVAAKCLHESIISPHNIIKFSHEMKIASKIRHPNLLQFIGATTEGNPIILIELMPTGLRKELETGGLAYPAILSISLDVACALNYLHLFKPHPILHRDVGSANVLLQSLGNCWRAKVSSSVSVQIQTLCSSSIPGNPAYSAPEAANPKKHSPAMDVFSYGVLLIEMALCQFPLPEKREGQIKAIKRPALKNLIERCLIENYKYRPVMSEIIKEFNESFG